MSNVFCFAANINFTEIVLIVLILIFASLSLYTLRNIKKVRSKNNVKPELSEKTDLSSQIRPEGHPNKFFSILSKIESDVLTKSVFGKVGIGKFKFDVNIGNIIFFLILIVGVAVRVYKFGSIPSGINQDAASGAYDAFALANYGVDRNGDSFPVHFVAWGSGMNSLYAYFIIPIIKIFGLSEATASSGNLIFAIISILIMFFTVKTVKNMEMAIISTFILAIAPWHIMLSRWGLLENILPAIVLIGVFFYVRSFKKPKFVILYSVFMSLALYTYGTAYFTVPVIMLCLGLYELYFASNKADWFKKYVGALLVFVIVSIPILIFIYINIISPSSSSTSIKLGAITIPKLVETGTRYKQVVFFSGDFNNMWETITRYFGYYYDTVFKQQGVIWNVINQYGNIYLISNYFFIIGFIASILGTVKSFITKKMKPDFVFLIWFLVSSVQGIINETNTNRLNILFIPMIYLVAYGIYVSAVTIGLIINSLVSLILSKKISFENLYGFVVSKASIYIVVCIIYINLFSSFTDYYFKNYSDAISYYFRESFKDAIDYTVEANPSNKTVFVSNFTEAYVYVLFYTKFDPREFYKTVHYANPNTEFRPVTSFANYRFVSIEGNPVPEDNCFYIVENDKVSQFADKAPKRVERFKKYTVLEF